MTHAAENPATTTPDNRVNPVIPGSFIVGICHIGSKDEIDRARIVNSVLGPQVTVHQGAVVEACYVSGVDPDGIDPGRRVYIGEKSFLFKSTLGPGTSVGKNTVLDFVNTGEDVSIGNGVIIKFPRDSSEVITQIGDNSVVGDGVFLLRGRVIGPDCYVLPFEQRLRGIKKFPWSRSSSVTEVAIDNPFKSNHKLIIEYGDEPPRDNHGANGITLAERMA